MASTKHKELVSELELDQLENLANQQFGHALSRWKNKDNNYAKLLRTRWLEVMEIEAAAPGQRKNYCVEQFKIQKETVRGICKDMPRRIKANYPVFRNVTKNDQNSWQEAQEGLRETVLRAPVLLRQLVRISSWQKVAFAAKRIDLEKDHGLGYLKASIEKYNRCLDTLRIRLQWVFRLNRRLLESDSADDTESATDEPSRIDKQSESNE